MEHTPWITFLFLFYSLSWGLVLVKKNINICYVQKKKPYIDYIFKCSFTKISKLSRTLEINVVNQGETNVVI